MKKAIIIITLLLMPMIVQAKTFYITQGMGMETWVIAMSSRIDAVELSYDAYGGEVIKAGQLTTTARPRNLSWWEAA